MLDLGSERLSWRRFGSLLARLPWDSELMRAIHGSVAEWSTSDHLLATVVDLLAWANYQRSDPKKSQKPKPLPRPGEGKPRKKLSTTETRRRLEDLRRRDAARRRKGVTSVS